MGKVIAQRLTTHPPESARSAGLRYVTDRTPGIRRVRSGSRFCYIGIHGRMMRDRRILQRIRSLVIPPAWTEVWICPIPAIQIQTRSEPKSEESDW